MIKDTDTPQMITEKLKFLGVFLGFSVLFFFLGAAGCWAVYFGSVATIFVVTVPIINARKKTKKEGGAQ